MTGLVNVDVGSVTKGFFELIDNLFTSDAERAEAKLKVLELESKGMLAQIAVNMTEAKSESLFVAGWRPFVGWVCGAALAYTYLFQPFLVYLTFLGFEFAGRDLHLDKLPELDLGTLMPVLMGLLGLAYFRTEEKKAGVNMNR